MRNSGVTVGGHDKHFVMAKSNLEDLQRNYKVSFEEGEAEVLGQGAFGTVIKAREQHSGNEVAIKKVNTSNFSPLKKEMLEQEILVMQNLNHPNIGELMELY